MMLSARRVFLIFTFLFFCGPDAPAQHAAFDLGKTDWKDHPVVSLDQQWEFYWNQFVSPSDLANDSTLHPDLLVAPSSWNDLVVNGKKCGSYGYATYRITLTGLPAQQLSLDVFSMQTACRIFVNGVEVTHSGSVGTDAEKSLPMTRDLEFSIPENAKQAEIIIQVSNFHHRKGGFVRAPVIGPSEEIAKEHLLIYVLDATESAALAIIGLFLLALFIFRRKDLSVLYFSLFCITLSLRPIISINYLLATLLPGISWGFMLKLEYLGVLFPSLFMTLYIKELFPRQLPSFIVKIFSAVFIIKILITLLFPPSVFSWLVLPILVFIPFGIIVLTIVIIRAVMARVEGANYAGIGIIILFTGLILKVLSYAGIIREMTVLITALDIGFIFMMSLILGSRFSIQFVKVELLQVKTQRQSHEITLQKQQVEKQKEILEEKNKEILDSIHYAKRIQDSLLPSEKYIDRKLKELDR
ncbi:MAG TPA: 7TM-DISM domain-containing protein [Bacteroidia bacterium]|jgi:hypothetical protein|nr:7TM-DISM domain-containing protein [Bacteroidia bacterium]